ncbi:MAG: ABC transporter ATP-binding protein [Hyphomicrobiaceae bacterium]
MRSLLEIDAVSVSFGGLRALHNVSFAVPEGIVMGIMGPNGAGKTTLFNVISGFLVPSGGSVRFRSAPITGERPHALCKQGMARTFQIAKPFPELTVLETVRIGALNRVAGIEEATERAIAIIEEVGLAEKAAQPGKHLTVVERKRLEFARALATQPALLLLDEVAAGLRPNEIQVIVGLIRNAAAKGVTVLMIEHIMEAILSASSRIVLLNHGEVLGEGAPQDIVKNRSVIDPYLGTDWARA